ncbi:ArsA family ATPase [Salinibaculum salinum]|uniref:ArsA family ATPase n=1 Tax=Salinibaculum salinum TaxID=3131996 RepID=UPI0030EEAB5A
MELEVETVEDVDDAVVPDGIDAPDYVLYGGKGGVGKTTMAAATALASARDGTATLVVSTDPAHSLSDTLETDIPSDPARIREDIPLFAAEIDPEEALEDGPFGGGDAGGNPLAGLLGEDAANPLGSSMPGSDEAAAIRLLLEYMDDPRFDRVVVDTAPTGHTLRLLELPEMLDTMVGKLLTMRERLGGMMEGMAGLFGDSDADPEEGIDSLREFSDRIEQFRAVLRDPAQTDFRVVMVPEELSVRESERLLDRLEGFGVPVGTVVVNRVMQDPGEVADVGETFVAPNHTDCEFCERRWQVQRQALNRSQDIFRGHDVRRVPLFAEEVRGERLLRVVAACIED